MGKIKLVVLEHVFLKSQTEQSVSQARNISVTGCIVLFPAIEEQYILEIEVKAQGIFATVLEWVDGE